MRSKPCGKEMSFTTSETGVQLANRLLSPCLLIHFSFAFLSIDQGRMYNHLQMSEFSKYQSTHSKECEIVYHSE